MWQTMLQPYIDKGALVAIGVVQEQHADRARLYKQWRQLDWPIFVDAANLLDHRVVPIPMAVDENGQIVFDRMRGRKEIEVFLDKDFGKVELPKAFPVVPLGGDKAFLAGGLDRAVAAYAKEKSPRGLFRLGVALRARFESKHRQPGDGQAAVDAWTAALQGNPNQYIWRRRLQQYGPRLAKPYNFYGWIQQARSEIRARGEEPVPLSIEPRGAELISRGPVSTVALMDKDPGGKIERDAGLVTVESIVTPARVQPGRRVRVRLVFRVGKAYWNNETDPLHLFVEGAGGFSVAEGIFTTPNPEAAETREARVLEFELAVPPDARPGPRPVKGYALYNVCESKAGVCRYLRQDIEVKVTVDPQAVKLGR